MKKQEVGLFRRQEGLLLFPEHLSSDLSRNLRQSIEFNMNSNHHMTAERRMFLLCFASDPHFKRILLLKKLTRCNQASFLTGDSTLGCHCDGTEGYIIRCITALVCLCFKVQREIEQGLCHTLREAQMQ